MTAPANVGAVEESARVPCPPADEPTMPLCPAHGVPFCADCTEDCPAQDLVLERISCEVSGLTVTRWVHKDGTGCRANMEPRP